MLKLDAMENPFRLPPALQAALGAAARRAGAEPLPGRPRQRPAARRWPRTPACPTGFDIMLGNGSDELISLLAMACDVPGATRAGAGAGLRDVRA